MKLIKEMQNDKLSNHKNIILYYPFDLYLLLSLIQLQDYSGKPDFTDMFH